jgi:hypothetical protein
MTKIKVNIRELVTFYDESDDAQKHSSAIKSLVGEPLAFALLRNYFDQLTPKNCSRWLPADQNEPAGKFLRCTTGGKQGHWLDGWFEVKRNGSDITYYQVEVKSWSFHGIGNKGQRLPVDVVGAPLRKRQIEIWKKYWDGQIFRQEDINKVLLKMQPPTANGKVIADAKVLPLVCLWEAVHPGDNAMEGRPINTTVPLAEFFSVKPGEYKCSKLLKTGDSLTSAEFEELFVFSMSTYLRKLLANKIDLLELELPLVGERRDCLNKFFPIN